MVMNKNEKITRLSADHLLEILYKWSLFILITSIVFILFCTLFPFNFSQNLIPEMSNLRYAFRHSTDLIDSFNNVLLFIPFGFGLTALFASYRIGTIPLFIIILIASASLSFTVEFLQILLPSRATTIADIINNSIGGLLGFLCFHLWKYKIINSIEQSIERFYNSLSVKNLTIVAIAYTIFYLTIAGNLAIATSLSNWNPQYYLQLGNEATGDRPWEGYITELAIADRVLSETEVANAFAQNQLLSAKNPALIANYQFTGQFTGQGNLIDTTGNAPQLSWQGEPQATENFPGVFLSPQHWLKTKFPATAITEKIRHHSQFTFSTTFTAKETSQTGPARIISFSQDAYERNFTLSQDESNLVLRMRTPITGNNGSKPQLAIHNFFTDGKTHHLIITYNGSAIKFYLDGASNIYTFNFYPGFAFFNFLGFLGSSWYLDLDSSAQLFYNGFYYSLIFIPWGVLLALLTNIVRPRVISRFVLAPTLILFPAAILESLISHQSGVDWQWKNVIASIAIAFTSMIIFKLKVKHK
jgi:glycopeptide antibiotics resistance protein